MYHVHTGEKYIGIRPVLRATLHAWTRCMIIYAHAQALNIGHLLDMPDSTFSQLSRMTKIVKALAVMPDRTKDLQELPTVLGFLWGYLFSRFDRNI